jgi:imidazolonepropionase
MLELFTGISELVLPFKNEDNNSPVEVIRDAALLVENGKIIAFGRGDEVKSKANNAKETKLGQRAVVPGFVDSHTHAVFVGDRCDDFSKRARGETYGEIAAKGGGILSSVKLLQNATHATIQKQSLQHLETFLKHGTTTCEIKSGYGLLPEHELRQLKVIGDLRSHTPMSLLSTVLAHVILEPEYVEVFCEHILKPAAEHKLAQFCDVFVEEGSFTHAHAEKIALAAKACGLKLKLHVDQLHDGRGAELAARLNALSADHLEYTLEAGGRALAKAGTIATILPGCSLFLGKGPWPSGRKLRDVGCEVAIATDFNPGSSHIPDLALCGAMAATRCGLTLEEALWGITRGGAKALDLHDRGCLRIGERADFVLLNASDWRKLFYTPGSAPIRQVFIEGKSVNMAPAAASY